MATNESHLKTSAVLETVARGRPVVRRRQCGGNQLRTADGVLVETPIPSLADCQLIDIGQLAKFTLLSKPTLWRHEHAGMLPKSCRIGRAVRWRLQTGDPATGILDWIEAGCVLLRDAGAEDLS